MARAMWTGFLSFGLVNVPVGLYSATKDQTLHFHQLHKGTSNRIRYKKVDEVTGDEVDPADIVSGYDVGDGEYVIISRDELKEAAPGRSEMIEISDFVDLHEIDPKYFRQTYYLAPRGKGADRAYALLRQAMRDTDKVGIATLVLRDKEHLVAVRPTDEVLNLETMFFADEIRDAQEEIDNLPGAVEFKDREIDIAKQLIESLATTWSPEQYKNTYRERVEALVEEKRKGQSIVFHTEQPRSNVIDLMAALEASVARSGSRRAEADEEPGTAFEAASEGPEADQQSFEGMSKAELIEQAAKLDVQGRSKMSKLQLVEALTAASAAKPQRRRKVS